MQQSNAYLMVIITGGGEYDFFSIRWKFIKFTVQYIY